MQNTFTQYCLVCFAYQEEIRLDTQIPLWFYQKLHYQPEEISKGNIDGGRTASREGQPHVKILKIKIGTVNKINTFVARN